MQNGHPPGDDASSSFIKIELEHKVVIDVGGLVAVSQLPRQLRQVRCSGCSALTRQINKQRSASLMTN